MIDLVEAGRNFGISGTGDFDLPMSSRPTRPLPVISPSSVADTGCPKKFWTLRVLNQWPSRREPNEAAALGSAAHDVLQQLYSTRQGSSISLAHVGAQARSALYRAHLPDGVDRGEAMEKVVAAVTLVVRNDDDEDVSSTIALERQVRFVYKHRGEDAFVVSARLDRVLRRQSEPTTIVNVDYKFGNRRIDLEQAFLTLWALKQGFPGYSEYVLHYDWINIADGQIRRDVIKGSDVRGQFALVRDAVLRIMDSDEHPPEPGPCCQFCPIRDACESSVAVGMTDGGDVF